MDRLTTPWNGLVLCNADAATCKTNNPSPKYDADCCCDCPRQQDIYTRLATYEDIGTVDELVGLKAQLEQVTAERDALVRFKAYWHALYGEGLEVANWHMNGSTEPFDNFYDSAEEEEATHE